MRTAEVVDMVENWDDSIHTINIDMLKGVIRLFVNDKSCPIDCLPPKLLRNVDNVLTERGIISRPTGDWRYLVLEEYNGPISQSAYGDIKKGLEYHSEQINDVLAGNKPDESDINFTGVLPFIKELSDDPIVSLKVNKK